MTFNAPPGKFAGRGAYAGSEGAMTLTGRSDNRFNRPGVVDPDDFINSRMVQGEVTANRTFNDELFEARTDTTVTDQADHRIDHVRDRQDLYIREGDLLMAPTSDRALDGRILIRNTLAHLAAPDVISTFRGMFIQEDDSKNYDQWQRSWVNSGFAKTKIEVGVNTDGTVVACAVAGGMSIPVNNSETMEMGRMLRYKLPHPKQEERLKEYLKHKHLGYHVDVCRPIIEVEKPEHMLQLPRAYLGTYLNEYGSSNLDSSKMSERDKVLRAVPENAQDVDTSASDNKRFFMSEYLEGSATDALMYMTLFARIGLCKMTLPTDAAGFANLSSLNTLTADVLHAGHFRLDDGHSVALAGADLIDASQDQRRQTLVLAGLLGLTEYENVPNVPQLRDLLVRTRLRGLMTPGEHDDHYNTAGIIKSEVGQRLNEEHQLDLLQDNRARKSVRAFHRLYWSLGRQRIGRTTSHGGNGKEVDIVF